MRALLTQLCAARPDQQHAARRIGPGYLAALVRACGQADAAPPPRRAAAAMSSTVVPSKPCRSHSANAMCSSSARVVIRLGPSCASSSDAFTELSGRSRTSKQLAACLVRAQVAMSASP